jgi:hypothetical protein
MGKMKPPKIKFRDAEPLQDYYSDRNGDLYSVARLVDEAKNLKPFDVPLASLNLSAVIWDDQNILGLAFHCKKVIDADLSKPIILDWNGAIADGRHRVIKALIKGKRTIKAVRITWAVEPCRKAEQ